jgi:hypothetical protein
MRRTSLTAAILLAAASLATACDDGSGSTVTDTNTVVQGSGRPFDGNVTPGIETPTNETENQGFDPEDAPGGPVGNGLPAPPSD